MQQQGGGRGVWGGGALVGCRWVVVEQRSRWRQSAYVTPERSRPLRPPSSRLLTSCCLYSLGKNKNVLDLNSLLAARDIVLQRCWDRQQRKRPLFLLLKSRKNRGSIQIRAEAKRMGGWRRCVWIWVKAIEWWRRVGMRGTGVLWPHTLTRRAWLRAQTRLCWACLSRYGERAILYRSQEQQRGDQNAAVPTLHPVKNKQIILAGKFLWLQFAARSLKVEKVLMCKRDKDNTHGK